MQVTDAHAHIFSDDEKRYPILESARRRPPGIGTVSHLRKDMATAGVQRVVAIHTSMINAYGPDRCVWGSDFPCEYYIPQVTYDQHLALFIQALNLSDAEQEAILSTTPGRLWFGE